MITVSQKRAPDDSNRRNKYTFLLHWEKFQQLPSGLPQSSLWSTEPRTIFWIPDASISSAEVMFNGLDADTDAEKIAH